jgi:chaperone modulatory protein CbpM
MTMMALEQVLAAVERVDRRDLTIWIERRWVRPRHEGGGYLFSDLDVARVTLICDMRHDMAIDDEAMPVVLGLLDQVYAMRTRLRHLVDAVAAQPEEVRLAVAAELGRQIKRDDEDHF